MRVWFPWDLDLVWESVFWEAFSQQENILEYKQIAENLMYPQDV